MSYLNDEQKEFFSLFGFLHLKGVFQDEISEIADAFEEVWKKRGGQEHSDKRSCIVPFIDQHRRLSALLDDERIAGVASSILGNDFNYCTSDGNLRVGDTPFHSQPFYGNVPAMKIAFYLDAVGRDSGCLRVIPGSHRFGDSFADRLHEYIYDDNASLGLAHEDLPAVAVESSPGDLVIFNHCVKHGAFGGGSRRRMFVINLSERFPDNQLVELRRMVADIARFHVDSYYGPAMLETAGAPRMVHLEQVLANQSHLPPLAAAARASMPEPARG